MTTAAQSLAERPGFALQLTPPLRGAELLRPLPQGLARADRSALALYESAQRAEQAGNWEFAGECYSAAAGLLSITDRIAATRRAANCYRRADAAATTRS